MARRYVNLERQHDGPQPLKSNWPDMAQPIPDGLSYEEFNVQRCDANVKPHTAFWRYIIYKRLENGDDRLIQEFKIEDKARKMLSLMRREKGLWLFKYEPTEAEVSKKQRDARKDWRWEAGFGA